MTSTTANELVIRPPSLADGAGVDAFIRDCGTLEPNTGYCYLLLCSHFSATSAIAMDGDVVAAFLGAYRIPERQDTLFVWQVGVAATHRRQGLAGRLIKDVLAREENSDINYIEASVAPSNTASRTLFASLAKAFKTKINEHEWLLKDHFTGTHEEEPVLRIGPVSRGETA